MSLEREADGRAVKNPHTRIPDLGFSGPTPVNSVCPVATVHCHDALGRVFCTNNFGDSSVLSCQSGSGVSYLMGAARFHVYRSAFDIVEAQSPDSSSA